MKSTKSCTLFLASLIFLIAHFEVLSKNTNSAPLSIQPNTACKIPPKKFSKNFLNKKYETYFPVGGWQIIDINGDGWCDWIRGGNEGHRKDEEAPAMRDFIYLGTRSGWLSFAQSNRYKDKIKIIRSFAKDGYITGDGWAAGFFEPIVIYARDEPKPYIATVFRPDGPAPFPNREDIVVYQWDDIVETLHQVNKIKRLMIIDFLHKNACGNPPNILIDGFPAMISMGNLCQ